MIFATVQKMALNALRQCIQLAWNIVIYNNLNPTPAHIYLQIFNVLDFLKYFKTPFEQNRETTAFSLWLTMLGQSRNK